MSRRLGQHFLSDPGILDRIVEAIRPEQTDVVIEIGPGEGTLTRRLAPRVAEVVALEKDAALADALPAAVPPNVRVVAGDALDLDWHALVGGGSGPHKVIGNVPYYITTPLIEQALRPPMPALVVFLVQREVADRVAAPPGDKTYGALSVGVQAVARAERLFTVRAGAFRPPPKVDSAVVRLTPLAEPAVEPGERQAFRRFVVGLFGQRRKQLARGLRVASGLGAEESARACAEAGVPAATRPETLSVADFVRLFRVVVR